MKPFLHRTCSGHVVNCRLKHCSVNAHRSPRQQLVQWKRCPAPEALSRFHMGKIFCISKALWLVPPSQFTQISHRIQSSPVFHGAVSEAREVRVCGGVYFVYRHSAQVSPSKLIQSKPIQSNPMPGVDQVSWKVTPFIVNHRS